MTSGKEVEQQTFDGASTQKWKLVYYGGGDVYTIRSAQNISCYLGMAIVLMHETAHTLGIDDVYDNVGHDVDDGFRCVMERFDKEYANEYYENVLSGVEDPFCPSCLSKMKKLAPNTFYSGN